jgi:hypothetical protein
MTRNDGLWLFIAVSSLNIVGLVVDYGLLRCNLPTVTEFCRRNIWAGALILCTNGAGTVGLAIHLLRRNGGM